MRIRRNRDNKIKIPWYARRVPIRRVDEMGYSAADFSLRFPRVPRVPRPQPVTVAEPVTQPAVEPVTEPGQVTIRVPEPSLEPSPVPDPFPGIPLPRQAPEEEAPIPPFQQPVPEFPLGFRSMITDPDYDWEAHFRRIGEQYEQTVQGRPEPMSDNPMLKGFEMIAKPILYLTVGKAMLDNYVEAKITDPIYSKMLETPVLGDALREAEQAEMDVEALANYFANYDWDNMDTDEMLKDLTMIIGAAGAARIIVYFIGRKVVFRI